MTTNWKQELAKTAASQEQVDYSAIAKAFMDQAYGFVANKAKPLFRDPHRLGFEIVRRNEKATRMVGVFVFRVAGVLMFVPVFFVNGEVKPVDMIYDSGVKRFKLLSEDSCNFMIEGMNQESGRSIDRERTRQPDGHIDRLAYPQTQKYASEDFEAAFVEMLKAATEFDAPAPLILPRLVAEVGEVALEKLAGIIDNEAVARAFSEFYDVEEMAKAATQVEKSASAVLGELILIEDHLVAKDAAEGATIMFDGYCLRDSRPSESKAVVVDFSDNVATIQNPGVYDVMLKGGENAKGLYLAYDEQIGERIYEDSPRKSYNEFVLVNLDTKQVENVWCTESTKPKFFGTLCNSEKLTQLLSFGKTEVGKFYYLVDVKQMCVVGVMRVAGKKDKSIELIAVHKSQPTEYFFSDDQDAAIDGRAFSDNLRFLEFKPAGEVGKREDASEYYWGAWNVERWETPPMGEKEMEKWLRTAGFTAASQAVTVDSANVGFDIRIDGKKAERGLTKKEAHVALALRYNVDADTAKEMVETTGKEWIVFQREKSAFSTQIQPEMQWEESRDPVFGKRMTFPQEQVLSAITNNTPRDSARIGDRYEATKRPDLRHKLPDEQIFSMAPEQLAQTAASMNLPNIFDTGVVGQLSSSVFDAVAQVDGYIADMEVGLDRVFRTLFLMRYRPAEFEDSFGKDTLIETEQEFSELGKMMGEVILKMIRRHRSV